MPEKINKEPFQFSQENLLRAQGYLKRYPEDRHESAVMPLLRLAQEQSGGWLPHPALEYVANYLQMPVIKVLEIASFYTMFNLKPVGENFIQICRTTPCWLRGASQLTAACKRHLGVELNQVTPDNKFSIREVECLGACANAPMVQINDNYYEDLTEDSLIDIIDHLRHGKSVRNGSQMGRQGSKPFKADKERKHRKEVDS